MWHMQMFYETNKHTNVQMHAHIHNLGIAGVSSPEDSSALLHVGP